MSRKTDTPGYQLVKEKMGFMGRLSRILLWSWQLLIAIWFFTYMADVSPLLQTDNEFEAAGAAIGMGFSWLLIGGIWLVGTVIFGIMTMSTKPTKALVPVADTAPTEEGEVAT